MAILCGPSVYEFQGVTFEFHRYFGPCPVTEDGEPVDTIPASFWPLWERFNALADKDEYLVHRGGCRVV